MVTFVNMKRAIILRPPIYFDDFVDEVTKEIKSRFELSDQELKEILDWYENDIEDAFFDVKDSVDVKPLVDSFVKTGKLKWKNIKT